jgi:hypothetical protein
MVGPGDRRMGPGPGERAEGAGGTCDRCQQPGRLVYYPSVGTRGAWLCPACLAALETIEGGSEARRSGLGEGANLGPGPGAWAGCAIVVCLLIIWALIGLAALLHRH